MGEKWPVNLSCDSDSHVIHRVLLHAANLRHGTDNFTPPTRRKACCGIFRLKNPTASAGFESAILGTRGQHARPPNLLTLHLCI
jgi:hypothetical protein